MRKRNIKAEEENVVSLRRLRITADKREMEFWSGEVVDNRVKLKEERLQQEGRLW